MSGFYSLVPRLEDGPSLRWPGRTRHRYPGVGEGGKLCRFQREQALIWTPHQLVGPGIITLGQGRADRVGTLARTALVDRMAGRSLGAQVTVEQMIRDMALNPPRDRDGTPAWNPVVPRKDGRLHVIIGPPEDRYLVRERVAARGPNSQDIQDTFTRANGQIDGSTSSDTQFTWDQTQGATSQANIASNQALLTRATDNAPVLLFSSLDMDTVDHYAQAELTDMNAAAVISAPNVFVRVRFGTNATGEEGYGFEVVGSSSFGNGRRVWDFADDSTLDSDSTLTTAGLLKLEFDGSDYEASIDGTPLFTGTDSVSAHATFKRVGMGAFLVGSNADATFDNFRAADLETGVTHYTLDADSGTFAHTGFAAGTRVARKMAGSVGAFALTGQDVTLDTPRRLAASAAAFTLSGQAVTLRSTRRLTFAQGTFAVTGIAATLRAARMLAMESGVFSEEPLSGPTFVLTGNDVNFLAGGQLSLSMEPGEFTLSGQATALLASRRVAAETGELTLAGQAVALTRAMILDIDSGAYLLTGRDAGLRTARLLDLGDGAFTWTGLDAILRYSGVLEHIIFGRIWPLRPPVAIRALRPPIYITEFPE